MPTGNRLNATTPPARAAGASPHHPLDPDAAPRPVVALAETVAAGVGRPHRHRRHQLIYASEGVISVVTGAGLWVVPAHRAVWVPGGTLHRVDAGGSYRLCTLYVAPRFAAAAGLPGQCRVVAVTPLLRELLLAAAAVGADYPRTGAAQRLMATAVDQIRLQPSAGLALPMPRDRRAVDLAQALLNRCADTRSLAQWGREVGASARTLERLFRSEAGMGFSQWRTQLRAMAAVALLAQGQSVTQVALGVGYEDVSSFIAMFKRTLGVTPRRYLAGPASSATTVHATA